MKNYRGAVFFDFDGTLVDEGEKIFIPTKSTKDSIQKLQENNFMVGLATGRARCYVPETGIDFDCYITSNGACATVNGEYIINDKLTTNELTELISYFDENNYGYITENHDACYYSKNNYESFMEMMNHFNISMNCFFPMPEDINIVQANKMMFTYNGDKLFSKLIENFGDKYNIAKHRSNPSGDLVKQNISKASGINQIMKHFKLDLNDTYAFGDGDNDYDMLKTVGYGIAMGKHTKQLENIASFVTETVLNEGITVGLKNYGLI